MLLRYSRELAFCTFIDKQNNLFFNIRRARLVQYLIHRLPLVHTDEPCVICESSGKFIKMSCCQRTIHKNCFIRWIREKNSCVFCRAPFYELLTNHLE